MRMAPEQTSPSPSQAHKSDASLEPPADPNDVDPMVGDDAQIVAVALRGVHFGDDPLTKERLLQVVSREFEARGIKEEISEDDIDGAPSPYEEVVPVSALKFNRNSIACEFREGQSYRI